MISETKIDGSFFFRQFLLSGYTRLYRLDRNSNGGGVLVFIREDIPSTKLHFSEAGFEGFFTELNLRKSKWLGCFSYNARTNKISNHLSFISKTLDLLSIKYEKILLISDFNLGKCSMPRDGFYNIYNLCSLIKVLSCHKNPSKPTCIDFTLVDLVTFTEEILDGKLHFLCSA